MGDQVDRGDVKMETYRIEVGRTHQVQPGNIVGAIANEAGLGREQIGRIKILERFSIVDLAEGVSPETLDKLKNVFVAGQKLQISLDDRPRSDRVNQGGRKFKSKGTSRGCKKPAGKRGKRGPIS